MFSKVSSVWQDDSFGSVILVHESIDKIVYILPWALLSCVNLRTFWYIGLRRWTSCFCPMYVEISPKIFHVCLRSDCQWGLCNDYKWLAWRIMTFCSRLDWVIILNRPIAKLPQHLIFSEVSFDAKIANRRNLIISTKSSVILAHALYRHTVRHIGFLFFFWWCLSW